MPWHVAIDQACERRLGKLQIGTTRRGIGPAYADKASRIGIRVQDLLDPKILRQKIEVALAEKNLWLERVYEAETFDLDDVAARYESFAQRLRPYVADTSLLVDEALRDGKSVLFEGAQATLLDLDHGTYPFVTSSNPVASGAATGIGIGPNRLDEIIGVAKAYVTRVGEGPFPSEIESPHQERCASSAASSARSLDASAAAAGSTSSRFGTRCGVNGFTSLALTKLDVLSSFSEIPVCVRYLLRDGTETPRLPRAPVATSTTARPVYETLRGLGAARRCDALTSSRPRRGVRRVRRARARGPGALVGTGAERERVLARSDAHAREPGPRSSVNGPCGSPSRRKTAVAERVLPLGVERSA